MVYADYLLLRRRTAFDKLYKIIYECSADDLILDEDEEIEKFDDRIVIIKNEIQIDEHGDEYLAPIREVNYCDPMTLAAFICERINEIAKTGSEKLIDYSDRGGLDTRIVNALVRANYIYIEDLNGAKTKDLLKIRDLGKKGLEKLRVWCEKNGIHLED